MTEAPLILWFRRDLRLDDSPMLAQAVATGRPLLALFILDPETEAIGAAARWRLGLALESFARQLEGLGSRLILRRGGALAVLEALITETGAVGVHWSRLYDPAAQARDRAVKAMLRARGVAVVSHAGHLLHEPWQVATGQGGPYRVYTPFWQAVKGRDPGAALSPPKELRAPKLWPVSAALTDWQLGAGMRRGAAVVAPYQAVGEATALARLDQFLAGPIDHYASARDRPDLPGTSRLSENLTYRKRFIAELSPATGPDALAWFATVPRSWGLDPAAPYPAPMIDLAAGRARALAAYGTRAAG